MPTMDTPSDTENGSNKWRIEIGWLKINWQPLKWPGYSILLVALVFISYGIFSYSGNQFAEKWLQPIDSLRNSLDKEYADLMNNMNQAGSVGSSEDPTLITEDSSNRVNTEGIFGGYHPSVSQASSKQQQRLLEKIGFIRTWSKHHYLVFRGMYKNYFASLMISIIAGILAAIALIFITKKGWDAASPYAISSFLVMTAFALFFSDMLGVIRQKENIRANINKYVYLTSVENKVLTFLVTGKDHSGADRKIEDYLIHLDSLEVNFHLEFDSSQRSDPNTPFSGL